MSHISRFTPAVARQFHNEFDAFMKQFAENHGLAFKANNAKYTSDGFRTKVEFIVPTFVGMSAEETNWNKYCRNFGFTAEDFGRKLKMPRGNDVYEIVGINPRNYKYPIILKNLTDDRRYKYTANIVKLMLGK